MLQQGYTGDTTYYISLTVSNCCGSSTHIDSVIISPLPIVDFATTQDTGCAPLYVEFMLNNLVTVQGTDSVVFDWGDGTSTVVFPNPPGSPLMWNLVTHTFAGQPNFDTTYFVTLTGYTPCGVDSITKPIHVLPNGVQSFFNTTNYDDCEDLTVQVIDYAVGDSIVVSWCFDYDSVSQVCNQAIVLGGPDTLYHTYTQAGDYVIAQFVNNGCSYDTSYFLAQVRPRPVAGFSFAAQCFGDQTLFANQTTIDTAANMQGANIAGYLWDFGGLGSSNVQNPAFTFPAPGTYTITLIATSDRNCTDTLSQTLDIWQNPVASATIDSSCLGNSTLFLDNSPAFASTIAIWQIDWGDGSDTTLTNASGFPLAHLYTNPGSYTVALAITDTHGCSDSSQTTATVLPLPVPLFATDSVCAGASTIFTSLSLGAASGAALATWAWAFGDGQSATLSQDAPFAHLYPGPGVYIATLVLTDVLGCADSTTQSVVVDTLPVADFVAGPVCEGVATQFADASVFTSHPIVAWVWSMGDGTTLSGPDPTHIYATAGTYTVTLLVTDSEGCTHLVSKPVVVYRRPEAAFVPVSSSGCQPHLVAFSDASQGFPAAIQGWVWDFGDGDSAFVPDPGHLYTQAGLYTVVLTATDANGCRDTTSGQIEVFGLPTADFAADVQTGCAPQSVQFADSSTGPAALVRWLWSFGDGTLSAEQHPSHTYTSDGSYTVQLIAEDANGCADTVQYPHLIRLTRPVAAIAPAQQAGCPGSTFTFGDASLADTTLTGWWWDLGNGQTATGPSATATYHVPGLYTVRLVVENARGCRDTLIATDAVEIYTPPTARFALDANDGCRPYRPQITDLSVPGSAPVAAWRWDLGNGLSSFSQNPVGNYTQTGSYVITQIVGDTHGCTDTSSQTVRVTAPVADFMVIDSLECLPGSLTFLDLSMSDTALVRWWWDFGDGGQAVYIVNPEHRFATTGEYQVQLIVEDALGCQDSITKPVRVYEYPYPFAEELVRATVRPDTSRTVWVEWLPIGNPYAEFVQIEKSSNEGVTFKPVYAMPLDEAPSDRRYIDTDAEVDQQSLVYRMAIIDSCGNLSPYSNIGQTTFLQARQHPQGVELYWTPYASWQEGVKTYYVERSDPGNDSLYRRIPIATQTLSYIDTINLNWETSGHIYYRVWAYERFGNDTLSISNTITFTPDPRIAIPSAFSPNFDDINDLFVVNGGVMPPWAQTYRIEIFNRWGQLLFASDSPATSCDGTFAGTAVPEGVYVYKLTLGSLDGVGYPYSGTITLVR